MGLIERNKAGDRFAINQRNIIVRDVPCNLTSGRINPACWKTKMHPPWETIKISGGRNHRPPWWLCTHLQFAIWYTHVIACAPISTSFRVLYVPKHSHFIRVAPRAVFYASLRRYPSLTLLALPTTRTISFRYFFFFFLSFVFLFPLLVLWSLFIFLRFLSQGFWNLLRRIWRYEDRRRRTLSHIFQSFVGQFYVTTFPLRESSSRMCEYIQIFSSTRHRVTWILKSQ